MPFLLSQAECPSRQKSCQVPRLFTRGSGRRVGSSTFTQYHFAMRDLCEDARLFLFTERVCEDNFALFRSFLHLQHRHQPLHLEQRQDSQAEWGHRTALPTDWRRQKTKLDSLVLNNFTLSTPSSTSNADLATRCLHTTKSTRTSGPGSFPRVSFVLMSNPRSPRFAARYALRRRALAVVRDRH